MTTAVILALHVAAWAPAQAGPESPPRVTLPRVLLVPRTAALSPAADALAPPDVVLRWNEAVLQAVKADRTPPPLAARNLAVVHVAVFDAVNGVFGDRRPFLVEAPAAAGTSVEAAAAVAAHRALVHLYPAHVRRFDALLDDCLEAVGDEDAKARGIGLGQFVAEKVLAWRAGDGVTTKVAYRPGAEPGAWRPTPPDFRPALYPQWPRVKCFAIRAGDQFRPNSPPSLNSQSYAASFREVQELGAADSRVRSPEQTEIARFWADGEGTVTPPGHWNRIAQSVARSRGNSLAANARLFAQINVALADAAISCWDCKYRFNVWRPVQAIREADRDANPATDPEPGWEPLLPTPPFPAYTSGHSTFSGAAAAVLAHFFGTDAVGFTSDSDGLPGVTRSYAGFGAAAAEAGQSRIYGGIHWQFDNTDGLAGGRAVGDYVCRHFFLPRATNP